MILDTVRPICFSPTGTTRTVLEAIRRGIGIPGADPVDLTSPATAPARPFTSRQAALIGFPVYAGRLPDVALARFRGTDGNGAPAVLVVVYGNRAYEDALVELRDAVATAGFRPVAAAAFVGEHSYSRRELPIAKGRPDARDLELAFRFGEAVRGALDAPDPGDRIDPLPVPGNIPYREATLLSGIAPETREDACVRCGHCAARCPVAAIDPGNPSVADGTACIRCCACVKACPAGAKSMDDPRILRVVEMLHAGCRERKEPETFLPRK